MKKSAFLINTSRGLIINELDLIEALENDTIAGVGLDVYDNEPLPQDHRLRFLPNALSIISPLSYTRFPLTKVLMMVAPKVVPSKGDHPH